MDKLNINGRLVGHGEPPYIIAEIGSNHNGDMDLCRKLIDEAAASGAHAVKFQSWSKKSLICKSEYERNTEYSDKHRHFGSLEDMCEKYQLTPEQHREVVDYCRERGVDFLSSPFAPAEVDLLVELGAPAIKVASMDVNHLPLLEYIGSKGLPVLLSTGMASLGEVERAVATLRESGSGPICVLHCVSIYPPDLNDVHLNNMAMLRTALDLPVGFSDHTMGTAIPLAAVALGACIIEKHFTLDREMEGWDHWISSTPEELRTIVESSRDIFSALGGSVRTVSPAELDKRTKFRRSIVAARDLAKGHVLTMQDLDFKRPGTGIAPDEAALVVGRALETDVEADDILSWQNLGPRQ